MEEKDMYQGLTKSQITKLKKEESACSSHWDFLSFSEKLLEVGATIWLKKICLEQFKKEDYGIDMRKWISKLISINEIEAAEDLLKKAEKKVNDFNGYRELAELSCSIADFKNNYAKKLYDKALEKAGDDMYDLEALIVSVSDKNYLNDNKYTKNVVKIAVENCIDLAAVVSLIKLLKENSTDASVIDVLVTKGQQFCVAIKTMHSDAYENPEECTMDDFLAFIENISDKNEIHKLLTSCIDKIEDDIFQFIPVAEYYHKIEDSKNAIKCLELAIDKCKYTFDGKEFQNTTSDARHYAVRFLENFDNYGEESNIVKLKFLKHLDDLTPKIQFSKDMFKDYNLKCGRFLYIILEYKEKAKKYNYSISLDMEKRVVLGRRFDMHFRMGHFPDNHYIRWHDNQECPKSVRNAMDNTTQNFTGLITIKCSDNFENFIKNDADYHDEEYKKTYGGAEDFNPSFPNSKLLWEVNCKNGKIKNPSASFSDFCSEEEILNTVGSGKNIYDLDQLIWGNSNVK
jgi:hypothetical protein